MDDAIVVVEAVEHTHRARAVASRRHHQSDGGSLGPVIAIALILAAVFVPTAFIPGITGQLYKQFAVTIAISVLFSAFNALTLSPALSAMLLRPKKPSARTAGRFLPRVQQRLRQSHRRVCERVQAPDPQGRLRVSPARRAGRRCGLFRQEAPGSFLPDEDQGYLYAGLQLPNASSLQLSSEAAREVEKIIMDTPGVQYVSSVSGIQHVERRQRHL